MSKVVTKDTALKAIEIAFWNEDLGDAIRTVEENIITQPESIIKCCECQYWNASYRECENVNWETGVGEYFTVPAGFYCGWAERRTDG